MISTGIDVLDQRLGGLVENRYYIVSGAPGSGKTSVALHFLGAGLDAGDTCAILTQEDPGDLISQAEFLGYDFRTPAEQEQLIVLQYRLDFAHNYTRTADPKKLTEELRSLTGDRVPQRFVIDSIAPFLDTGGAMHETVDALVRLLESVDSTTYITVPGDPSEGRLWATFDRVRTGAAGIFHVEIDAGKVREFHIQKVRQAAATTDPFRFTIRPGLGIVASRDDLRSREELTPEVKRRVVVLSTTAELPEEFRLGLEDAYEVRVFESVEESFSELSVGNFGVLLQVFDPRQPGPAIQLTRELRRAGSGVPILYVTASKDLRASTRSKGLRAGGDDFLTDDLSLQEFLQRVEVARVRGFRVPSETETSENILLQPTDDRGEPLLLEEAELQRSVRHQMARSSHPFFAIVFLRPPDFLPQMWRVLCEDLRVHEGDLVGRMGDGRLVLYLHDVGRKDVRELLGRIVEMHPEFAMVEDVVVYSYPSDRPEVEEWLNRSDSLHDVEAP